MRRSSQQRQEFQVFGAQPSSAGSAQFPPAKHMQDFATHDQLQPEQHYSSRDIRRTHYGGQHYHQQQRQHPQHEAVVMHSLDDDAAYYDGSHPLPPSDPIYMDIESDRTGQPQLGQRGSSAQRRQRPVPEYSTQMYESSVTSPNNYHRSQQRTLISHRPPQPPSARKPTRKVPVTNNTPIMFGDPYEQGSVMTGMSQQELLRKKSREHSKQKKEKSRFRKKKKDRIVNMPGSLLGGTKYQRAAEDSKETSRKVPVYEIKQKSTVRVCLLQFRVCCIFSLCFLFLTLYLSASCVDSFACGCSTSLGFHPGRLVESWNGRKGIQRDRKYVGGKSRDEF